MQNRALKGLHSEDDKVEVDIRVPGNIGRTSP